MNLNRASSKGDLAAVKTFIGEGTSVDSADRSGRTPLIEAAWAGHLDVVAFLVESGANVNASDGSGYTALMRAAEDGHAEIVAHLIQNGADVNCRGKVKGTTPLMLAAEQGHVKVLEILIENGAKINAVDQFEETALARAYRTNQPKSAEFLESKGGRGKPERSSFTYSEKDLKPYIKASLPQWSAAAVESGMEEEETIEGGFEEE